MDSPNGFAGSPEPGLRCRDHPFVSIVVCTTGNRPLLERCLDSLSAQACPRSEILLVFNGHLEKALAQRMARYPARLFQEPRPGVSFARNSAIPKAQGDIIAFVDDDVVVDPDWLHEIVKGFEDSSVACVIGRVIPEGPAYAEGAKRERVYFGERALTAWTQDPGPEAYRQVLSEKVVGFGCNMAFQKSFLENYSRLPEDLGAGAVIGSHDENYMFIQVLKHGFRIRYTPLAAVTHFFPEEQASTRKARLGQMRAEAVAFRLKLLAEEKGHRWATFENLAVALTQALRACVLGRKSPKPRESLSAVAKLRSYAKGFSVFLKSRRSRHLAVSERGNQRPAS